MHTLRDRVFPVLSFGLARLHTRRKQCLDKKSLSDGLRERSCHAFRLAGSFAFDNEDGLQWSKLFHVGLQSVFLYI